MECPHATLVLLAPSPKKRCIRCHLTLSVDELGEGPCPECLESHGTRHTEFEDVADAGAAASYVCDDCGVPIGGTRR
ncbi:MAG TPA: hypothetical protein VEB21_16730 [Terriglobales bacterium]|nr:hypothetical protein [Terriglobales bacterium]